MNTVFTGRLQLEQNYETVIAKLSIQINFILKPFLRWEFDESEDLKKSIAKFIAL